jgi:hypothetical protein
MGNKELLRAKVMEMVREGRISLPEEARRLKRSERANRYLQDGYLPAINARSSQRS